MTVEQLYNRLAIVRQVGPQTEVLVRVDVEALDKGPVFEIQSADYTTGCTDTYSLMLDCGVPEEGLGPDPRQGALFLDTVAEVDPDPDPAPGMPPEVRQ